MELNAFHGVEVSEETCIADQDIARANFPLSCPTALTINSEYMC